jgi:hypothetical protein
MSFTGKRVRLDAEGSSVEATAVLISPNRASLLVDLGDDTELRYRDGSISIGMLPLYADGGAETRGDYTSLVNGAAVKVTWL